MRVGVVDIGTNSTRLLIADAGDGTLTEVDRRSTVTRLGEGVDATGRLGDEPMARVFMVLEEYTAAIREAGCEATTAVLTSAVRDAENGAEFAATVRERYGLDAQTIDGDTEARLTYLGATAAHDAGDRTTRLVCDIGGGSTELVVGAGGEVSFHVSTQAGVVRQTERHIHRDPPQPDEVRAIAEEVRAIFAQAVPADVRAVPREGIAVAGTATSCAAIDLELDPYDPNRVEGHRLALGTMQLILARLSTMTLEARRKVRGLHPDRAPTIVAGVTILIEVMHAFHLEEITVSERDILWGAALTLAADAAL
jgi:exopolyphosphatase/guanosine-5'-triphosphate,3'-diphosphate pyrophosphatase